MTVKEAATWELRNLEFVDFASVATDYAQKDFCVVFLAKKTRTRAMSKQRLLSKPDKSPTTVAAQNTFKQNIVTFRL